MTAHGTSQSSLALLALGLALGYALRRPICRHLWAVHLCQPPAGSPSLVICDRCGLTKLLPRHLGPAVVNREDDEGILPPDPRTWAT